VATKNGWTKKIFPFPLLVVLDPGSRIRGGKNQDPGSGIRNTAADTRFLLYLFQQAVL
jgi:hypothetical protein